LLLAAALLFFSAPSSLSAYGEGTTAFNFLKIGVGARPIDMGESFAAIADDSTAIYWNAAGLSQIQK
jgi:hypothetical protein